MTTPKTPADIEATPIRTNAAAIQSAIECVNASEWSHDQWANFKAAIRAGQVLAQALSAARDEINRAWHHIENEFDIEPRSEIEAEAKTNGFDYGLAQAIHTIWKRDPKVSDLTTRLTAAEQQLAAMNDATVLTAEKVMEMLPNHKVYPLDRHGMKQIQVDLGDRGFSFLVEADGRVSDGFVAIPTVGQFRHWLIGHGIEVKP